VSVVMPVFNAERWIHEAIRSIRNQTLADFEFIIVDDGSTDASESIIADAAGSDGRIHALRQTHYGVVAALNKGMAVARAKYIARIDADDVAEENRLELQRVFLESNPDVAALGTWATIIDEQGSKIGELKPQTDRRFLDAQLKRQNPFIHASMMFSTELMRQLGGYRDQLEGAEDYDLWLRMSERGWLANLAAFLLRHRRHLGSTSSAHSKKQLLAARLSRMSAARRRSSMPDFVSQLRAPIDPRHLLEVDELRGTGQFYSMLLRAPEDVMESGLLTCLHNLQIDHAERKAAQIWLHQAFKKNKSTAFRIRALFWLFYLHPSRAFSLVLSHFKRSDS